MQKRLKQYPKDSDAILCLRTKDTIGDERFLINQFKVEFKRRKDIGLEYFEGNVIEMIECIARYFKTKPIENPEIVVKESDVQETVVEESDVQETVVKESDVQETVVKNDYKIMIMEFIDVSRSTYSNAVIKSKDVYNAFISWTKLENIYKVISLQYFIKHLKKAYNINNEPYKFSTGLDYALIFPNLMPISDEVRDKEDDVLQFVNTFIKKTKGAFFTLKQAKELFCSSVFYNGEIQQLKNRLTFILKTKCIEQKRIHGKKCNYVFLDYELEVN